MKKEITLEQLLELIEGLSSYVVRVLNDITDICEPYISKKDKDKTSNYIKLKDKMISFVHERVEVSNWSFETVSILDDILGPIKVNKILKENSNYSNKTKKDLETIEEIRKNIKKLKIIDMNREYKFDFEKVYEVCLFIEAGYRVKDDKVIRILGGSISDLPDTIKVNNEKVYQNLMDILYEIRKEKDFSIFDTDGNLLDCYKNRSLKDINLSIIDFKDTNISGIDISDNIENLNINFDKIKKDLSNTNLKGYNSKGYVLRYFDLTNANLEDTSFGIDLSTCIVSIPSKLENGTQFDENNTFYFGTKELEIEKAKELGLHIKPRK